MDHCITRNMAAALDPRSMITKRILIAMMMALLSRHNLSNPVGAGVVETGAAVVVSLVVLVDGVDVSGTPCFVSQRGPPIHPPADFIWSLYGHEPEVLYSRHTPSCCRIDHPPHPESSKHRF